VHEDIVESVDTTASEENSSSFFRVEIFYPEEVSCPEDTKTLGYKYKTSHNMFQLKRISVFKGIFTVMITWKTKPFSNRSNNLQGKQNL
jgi:hypothetical protein